VEFQPAWLTFEIQQALARLPTLKARQTVLRLAEAQVVGRSETETFRLPEVCSRRTWYGRYRGGEKKPGWRDNAAVQSALKAATARALWWEDNRTVRSIQQAREQLALEAPENVRSMIRMRDQLEGIAKAAEEDKDKVQAADKAAKVAGDMLSRAGAETAQKEVHTFDLDDWQEKRRQRLAEIEGLGEGD